MNQKERLELIKKKHQEEQRKRKILTHRIIVAVITVVVLLIVVFSVKGCVSNISNRAEQKKQEEFAAQSTPVPTQTVGTSTTIDQNYYANSAFVGNSFIDGMSLYELISGADYFSKVGLNVNDAMTVSTDTGSVPVIEELNSDKQYSKIFMMFGENELGWKNSEGFVSQYGELIDKVKQYQSTSKIYLLAITPVTKKISDENKDNTTNEQILKYNELIKQLADDKGVEYADVHSAVVDSNGVLPEDAASDGVHFGEEYYKKCLLYIQNNLQ